MCVLVYYAIYLASAVTINENKIYPVAYVLDGDTFKVKIKKKEVTVRMLGIDTPETVDPRKPPQCYGKEASDETKKLLSRKTVRLKLNPNREEKDRYGRYLAYVYLVDNNSEIFINEFLLQNGYAKEYTYGKAYMFQKEFRTIEKLAQEGKKGLWGECQNETILRAPINKYPQ